MESQQSTAEDHFKDNPMMFFLPSVSPNMWSKAMILAEMEDGLEEADDDPDNTFIVHSYR